MTECDNSPLKSSSFYKEITGLPVFHSAEEIYLQTKNSSWILGTGLAVVEYSVSGLLDRIFTGSSLANRVDSMAGKGVSRLKEKYPALQSSPEEIRHRTSSSMKQTIRNVMGTRPGLLVVRGLDMAVDVSDGILKRAKPRNHSPLKRKTTRGSSQKPRAQKEHSYASEDSGACDADGESGMTHKSQQTVLTVKKEKGSEKKLVERAYNMGIVYPLEVLVKVLKSVRRYVGGKRYKSSLKTLKSLTPEKAIEIGARRKVSPRKKVSSSFIGSIKQRTLRLLGYKAPCSIDLGQAISGMSPDRAEAEKKRKHDEILSEGSETEEDMENFDFDNYESEEDPDYEPSSDEEGSSEYESDEDLAESDPEDTEGQDLVKEKAKEQKDVKDVKPVKDSETKPPATDAGTSVDKGDGVVLKPQWQK